MKAHHHFSDPEWDGEPIEPEAPKPCPKCGCLPCECEKTPPRPCPACGKSPCECPKERCPVCGKLNCVPLLRLKYHNSIADAVADLGRPDEIGQVFAGFQKYLYQQQAVA